MNCFLTVVANRPARTIPVDVIGSFLLYTWIKNGAWSIPGPFSYTAKSHPNLIPGLIMYPLSLKFLYTIYFF